MITQGHVVQINQSENRNSYSVYKLNNNVLFCDRVLEALLSFANIDPQSCLYENPLR